MLSFFPQDVLDEIWDVIESVSEGFLVSRFKTVLLVSRCKKLEHPNMEQLGVTIIAAVIHSCNRQVIACNTRLRTKSILF